MKQGTFNNKGIKSKILTITTLNKQQQQNKDNKNNRNNNKVYISYIYSLLN